MTTLDALAEIQRLAQMPEFEYDRERKDAAKKLGLSRVTTLDAEVKKCRAQLRGAKRFEHSNTDHSSHTETGASGCSNVGANSPDDIEQLRQNGAPLLEADDPLEPVRKVLIERGYAGDTRPAEMAFLAVASRFLQRPLNLHYEGPSAAGKNYAVDSGLEFHPPEAFYKLSASSPRALVYTDEEFKNRTVVLAEMDSIPVEGPAASAVRSIAQDAFMAYETVEKDPGTGQLMTRKIVKEGPTGLITTGTRPLDDQMSTRCLTVPMPDDPEQTLAVMQAEAREAEGGVSAAVDFEPFHAAQRWLAQAGERRIVVPFASELTKLVPAVEVRIRRDFKQLLTTVRAFGFLSQVNRGRTRDAAIVATMADYVRARRLLAPLFDSISSDGLTPAVRETVEAVEDGEGISATELAARLKLSRSTVSYRVRRAIRGGWLINSETRRGYAAKLSRAASLPEDRSALPTVDALREAFESRIDSNTYSNTNDTSGREGLDKDAFECSNENKMDLNTDDGLDLDPDPELSNERGGGNRS